MAGLIALELGLDPQRAKRTSCVLNDVERRILRMRGDDEIGKTEEMSMEQFSTWPPVVCIMGHHVDHDKTTLMDCLHQRALEASGGMKKMKASKKNSKKKKKSSGKEGGITKVVGTEAGGITQTVYAFQVNLPNFSDQDDDKNNNKNNDDED